MELPLRYGSSLSVMSGKRLSFHPLFDPVRIAYAGQFALGIKQHDQERTICDIGLHYQTSPGIICESCFGETDLPPRILNQAVCIMKLQYAVP